MDTSIKSIEEEIINILDEFTGENLLEKDNFTCDTKLFEGGLEWDSLEMLEAIYLIEEKFNIIINPEELKNLKTVRGIVECVNNIISHESDSEKEWFYENWEYYGYIP